MAAITPASPPSTAITMSWAAGKLGWVSPEDRAPASASPQPRKPPRASPPTVPNAATSTDSSRIMDRSWARVWPTARTLQAGIMTATSELTSAVSEPQGAGRLIWRYFHGQPLPPAPDRTERVPVSFARVQG